MRDRGRVYQQLVLTARLASDGANYFVVEVRRWPSPLTGDTIRQDVWSVRHMLMSADDDGAIIAALENYRRRHPDR